jgi:hypothetical protein
MSKVELTSVPVACVVFVLYPLPSAPGSSTE